MNFLEAVGAIKEEEGEGVKRKGWNTSRLIRDEKGHIMVKLFNEQTMIPSIIDIEAIDWEIYEDKKTLSDKRNNFMYHSIDNDIKVMGNPDKEMIDKHTRQGFFYEEDVKEALKEFFDRMKPDGSSIPRNLKLAREIFGDELISKV